MDAKRAVVCGRLTAAVALAGVMVQPVRGQAGAGGTAQQQQQIVQEIAELESAIFLSGEPMALDAKNLRQFGELGFCELVSVELDGDCQAGALGNLF